MSLPAEVMTEFLRRLQAAANGGPLNGWNVVLQPQESVQGKRDLPCVRLSMPSLSERDSGSGMATGVLTLLVGVETERVEEREGGERVITAIADHLNGVEDVKNAIETSGGAVDVLLGGLLIEPLEWLAAAAVPKGNSYNTALTARMTLRGATRGSRV